jgi:hypothetical protein
MEILVIIVGLSLDNKAPAASTTLKAIANFLDRSHFAPFKLITKFLAKSPGPKVIVYLAPFLTILGFVAKV